MNQRYDPRLTWRRSLIPTSKSGISQIAGRPAPTGAAPVGACSQAVVGRTNVGACLQAITPNNQTPSRALTQRGAGLIEVMVALLVLAIGLLGFAAMQTQGISQGQKAYLHSQAIFAAQDMVERMRANPIATSSYALSFTDSAPSGTDCSAADCSPAALAGWDQAQWLSLLEESLPRGDGQIQVVSTGTPTVVVISVRYRLNRDLDVSDQTANKNITTEQVYELRAQL